MWIPPKKCSYVGWCSLTANSVGLVCALENMIYESFMTEKDRCSFLFQETNFPFQLLFWQNICPFVIIMGLGLHLLRFKHLTNSTICRILAFAMLVSNGIACYSCIFNCPFKPQLWLHLQACQSHWLQRDLLQLHTRLDEIPTWLIGLLQNEDSPALTCVSEPGDGDGQITQIPSHNPSGSAWLM